LILKYEFFHYKDLAEIRTFGGDHPHPFGSARLRKNMGKAVPNFIFSYNPNPFLWK
jgi:hypothetical protein